MSGGEPPTVPPTGGVLGELAYGATKALIESLWKALTNIPQKLTNREIAFIGDPETRRRVKEKKATAEYAELRRYVEDDELWAVVSSGLALRDLERDPLQKRRLEALRTAIHSAHGPEGVQIAEIVQRGILTDIVSNLAKQGATVVQIRKELRTMLSDVVSHIEFVQTGAAPLEACRKISYKVSVSSPQIVMGRGHASDAVHRVARRLREYPGCHCELRETEGQTYLFVFRSDQWSELSKSQDNPHPPKRAGPRSGTS
ncbi:MAG: hypothetical protein L3J92_05125 [Thermoplasmata archaeon]|nr:hypothetical protein [Thermoplasmata archaeon]